MNLVIDEGNSSIKAGIFQGELLIKPFRGTIQELDILFREHTIESIIYCTVKKESTLKQWFPNAEKLTHNTPTPLSIAYNTPMTLGMDRLAGIIGSTVVQPEQNNLVIDIGTCITYDILVENVFLGGIISPGIKLRATSMHNYTAALPLVDHVKKEWPNLIGKNTKEALSAGVFYGIASEINEMIYLIKQNHPIDHVFVTGGDSGFFESKIKEPIFVHPELVLRGLNRIVVFNK